MSDISTLENRITSALDRIRVGLENRPQLQDTAALADLQTALEAERATNATLTQRITDLKEQLDGQRATQTAQSQSQQARLAALDEELQKLRAANLSLREMNDKLRAAGSGGVSPELHDASLAAEVAALEAQRAADMAEMDVIIAELRPLITEG